MNGPLLNAVRCFWSQIYFLCKLYPSYLFSVSAASSSTLFSMEIAAVCDSVDSSYFSRGSASPFVVASSFSASPLIPSPLTAGVTSFSTLLFSVATSSAFFLLSLAFTFSSLDLSPAFYNFRIFGILHFAF